MATLCPHPVGHMLFEAKDILANGKKYILLCDFVSSAGSLVPESPFDRQVAMQDFVATTGLQRVIVKTFVPIQYWRTKLGPFPFATDGLLFVQARRKSYASEVKFKWQV